MQTYEDTAKRENESSVNAAFWNLLSSGANKMH